MPSVAHSPSPVPDLQLKCVLAFERVLATHSPWALRLTLATLEAILVDAPVFATARRGAPPPAPTPEQLEQLAAAHELAARHQAQLGLTD